MITRRQLEALLSIKWWMVAHNQEIEEALRAIYKELQDHPNVGRFMLVERGPDCLNGGVQ